MDAKGFKSIFSILNWGGRQRGAAGAGAKDPVCGMTVDPQKAAATSTHAGTTYYFCCGSCRETFDREPQKYLAAQAGRG